MAENWNFPDPEKDLDGFLEEIHRFYFSHLLMPAKFVEFGMIPQALEAGKLLDKVFWCLTRAQRQVPYFRWV